MRTRERVFDILSWGTMHVTRFECADRREGANLNIAIKNDEKTNAGRYPSTRHELAQSIANAVEARSAGVQVASLHFSRPDRTKWCCSLTAAAVFPTSCRSLRAFMWTSSHLLVTSMGYTDVSP